MRNKTLHFIRTFATACFTLAAFAPALAMVHTGDELQVTIYNHPDLTRKVTVGASETLSLPLAGTIDVRGLEPAQIAARITTALSAYVRHPAVDVELAAQTASIFVSGGPGGVLKYQPGETLAASLADLVPPSVGVSAPGTEKQSGIAALERTPIDLRRVTVRRDDSVLGTYDALAFAELGATGPVMHPGDTIVLIDKPDVVRVAGDVVRPGKTYLDPDESLADAIDQAGGVTVSAASAHVRLQRDGVTRDVSLGDALMQAPARDGDVLSVPTAPRVSVVGLVEKPGPVLLKTDFSLLNALYLAGGPAKFGDLGNVTVVHDGASHAYNVAALVHGDTAKNNPTLADGDTVFVPHGRRPDYAGIFQTLSPLLYLLRPF